MRELVPTTAGSGGLDYLAVLKTELVGHVRLASGALDPMGAGQVEATGAAVCVDAMDQVRGVLQTLRLERLALLAWDLARVAGGLETLPAERRGDTLAILRGGLDQLREGIEQRAGGRTEALWGLVGALNDLRANSALPLVSEICLFAPGVDDWLAGLSRAPVGEPPRLAEAAQHERVVLHRALYLWYSDCAPARALRKLRRVARSLRKAALTEQQQRLFLILEAFIIGIADDPAVPGAAVRRVLAGVDQLLRLLGDAGKGAATVAPPLDLVRNLLFYVVASGSSHHVVKTVQQGIDLRLVIATDANGVEQVVKLVLAEAQRVRALVAQARGNDSRGQIRVAAQRLSDALSMAEVSDQSGQLSGVIERLQRLGGGAAAVPHLQPEADAVLEALEDALHCPATAAATRGFQEASVSLNDDEEAATMASVKEVEAVNQGTEHLSVEISGEGGMLPRSDRNAAPQPLDDEIRDVFVDEALEKVEVMRRQYVAWSAQRDDATALDDVLEALGTLKSTGRLVGADMLSEVCWVLEAALRRCRDGVLDAGDDVLAVLDDGIEMVDSLVAAHVVGGEVAGDPRAVEQRLYALLSPGLDPAVPGAAAGGTAGPAVPGARAVSGDVDAEASEPDAGAIEADFDLVELFAEEAGDLADALEEGLRALEQAPARSAWLTDMRRALRALALAARQADLPQLNALCEAFDGFLSRTAEAGSAISPGALALTREATSVVAGVVDSLRRSRLPLLPANLIDRLRQAGGSTLSPPQPEAKEAPATEGGRGARSESAGKSGSTLVPPLEPGLARRLVEQASGAGICHLNLEEQAASLRAQIGRIEGTLALLQRSPPGDLASRVAGALADLRNCADNLHETSLTISYQLRTQNHQLRALQQGLGAWVGPSTPTFSDLLLVGVGNAIYAIPAAIGDSVRRVAPEQIPAEGDLLELQGRPFVYRHLAGLLAVERGASNGVTKPQSVVLSRLGELDHAIGVDTVIGHRTLLVTPPDAGTATPTWLLGLAFLGDEREASVIDLQVLLAD